MANSSSGVKLTKRGEDIDLTIYQGKTLRFDLIWGGLTPIDVTGWAARMQLRPEARASNTYLNLTSDPDGGITVGTTDGKFSIFVSDEDCAELPVVSGAWDIELIDTDGNVYLGESGRFSIVAEVTRSV